MTSLLHLKRAAIAHTLFKPTTLARAIEKLGFLQADPIRAPARAQDLILRHRVKGYVDGQLEARYPSLDIEEEYFLNYGFLPREVVALMHPRTPRKKWSKAHHLRAEAIEQFVHQRETETHPDQVHQAFAHGRVTNAWGGQSRAGTELLHGLHYRGRLRVARREKGIRLYAPSKLEPLALTDEERAERLLAVAINLYAPLPVRSLGTLTRFLRWGAPHLTTALKRVAKRLSADHREGWLGMPSRLEAPPNETVRFLAPFDPLVWDRRRFEMLWGWAYRFEAYTPKAKRVRGYYALPLLWRDDVIGWANVADAQTIELGFVSGSAPKDKAFTRELDAERERLHAFL